MLDFVRVALIATLGVGAATVIDPNVAASKLESLREGPDPAPLAKPLAASPEAIDAPSVDPVMHGVVTPPAAKSLAQLVARFPQAGTADNEQICLAGAVYFESKGEPLEGQLAVARTIINRAQSGRFARSLCGVIHERGQFSFVGRSGLIPAVHREAKAWRTAIAVARIAIDDLWAGPARNALYFHSRRVAPAWGLMRLASVGNQVFYR